MRSSLIPIAAAAALLALPGPASAKSTRLDLDKLRNDVVHEAARRAVLAVDAQGRPLSVLLRIAKGQSLPPHGASGGIRLLTVVSGTLSWGDGADVDPAAERSFGPGSVIVIPAEGGEHWAAARQDDVVLQIVVVGEGKLAPEAQAQLVP
jgi:quercetin dioxygenase-like cupin family protein